MSYPCSRCEGEGYHFDFGGVFKLCEPCEGSGAKDGREPALVRYMKAQITREKEKAEGLQYQLDCAEERSREPGLRCIHCKGNGFLPDSAPWSDVLMDRCRKCNGSGVTGKASPLISRLWYEVEQLRDGTERRFEEWKRKNGFGVHSTVTVSDKDVWLHILGLSGSPSRDEIRKAYKDKAQEFHPDKGGSDKDFSVVGMAQENLLEPK